MASLPELPAVSSLSKYVTRVLGQNPSKFTLQGTNSYLVHHPHSTRMILIDTTGSSSSGPLPAESLSTYLASLRTILVPTAASPASIADTAGGDASEPQRRRRRYISDIILTHWHRDHTEAVNAVIGLLSELRQDEMGGTGDVQTPPVKVWKFPCTAEASDRAWAAEKDRDDALEKELAKLPPGAIDLAKEGGPLCRRLEQGQRFRLSAVESPTSTPNQADDLAVELQVAHTPGHTSDSVCLLLHESSVSASSPAARRTIGVFTADTVLGHGTAVFASLSAYLTSLSSLVSLLEESDAESGLKSSIPLFPGHGDVVQDGVGKIKEYRAHRLERERQVVEALKAADGPKTATELVQQIYGTTIPESLIPAATHGCLLHLAKLLQEGHVDRVPAGNGKEDATVAVEHEEMQIPPGWHDGWVVKVAAM